MINLIFSIPFLFLISCSAYVDKIHRQINNESNSAQTQNQKPYGWPYGKLKNKANDKRPIVDPITYTVHGDEELPPNSMQNSKKGKVRLTADDFTDKSDNDSLWNNFDSSSSLFTSASRKSNGDIVIINVNENLKRDISRELRKAFPKPDRSLASQILGSNDSKQANVKNSKVDPKKSKDIKANESDDTLIVYDKIASKVKNEVNGNHLVIKGRKEVFFRNEKKMVEIEALVRRSDVNEEDSVFSDKLIEAQITVLR